MFFVLFCRMWALNDSNIADAYETSDFYMPDDYTLSSQVIYIIIILSGPGSWWFVRAKRRTESSFERPKRRFPNARDTFELIVSVRGTFLTNLSSAGVQCFCGRPTVTSNRCVSKATTYDGETCAKIKNDRAQRRYNCFPSRDPNL